MSKAGPKKGKGGRPHDPHEKHSRKLTQILRHQAVEWGIPIDAAGYVAVDVLLARPEFGDLELANILEIVAANAKQRFGMEERETGWYIRANQGHSMAAVNADELLEPIGVTNLGDYPVVVHGTNPKAWASIKVSGLNKMGRQHVHFAKGLPGEGGVISGMRKGSEVMVYIDLAGAVRDGIPFFVSANGVILSPGEGDTGVVPAKYFKDVINGKTGAGVLNSDTAVPSAVPVGTDLPTLLAQATELSDAEKERWQQLHDEAATFPKVAGKPDPAVMAQLKAYKAALKAFISGLSSPEAKQAVKQLDAAAKKLKPKAGKSAGKSAGDALLREDKKAAAKAAEKKASKARAEQQRGEQAEARSKKQAVKDASKVKDTLIMLAGWLGFTVKFEVDDGEPVFNFQLPMPKWILAQKHLCEELEIFEDERMLLEADEAEEIVLGCAAGLTAMYFGEEFQFDFDCQHLKERLGAAVPIATKKGMPTWFKHMSYPLSHEETSYQFNN